MQEIRSYREIMGQQSAVRQHLLKDLMDKPISWTALAKDIGISVITLKKFAIDECDMDFIILNKIRNYNLRNEKQ
jgi:hypothetical protein